MYTIDFYRSCKHNLIEFFSLEWLWWWGRTGPWRRTRHVNLCIACIEWYYLAGTIIIISPPPNNLFKFIVSPSFLGDLRMVYQITVNHVRLYFPSFLDHFNFSSFIFFLLSPNVDLSVRFPFDTKHLNRPLWVVLIQPLICFSCRFFPLLSLTNFARQRKT